MKVLVVGASGLIGGRLLAALSSDVSIGLRAASRIPRTWPPGVEGVVTDSSVPATLAVACDGVDAVVNLASMDEAACAADPRGALVANAGGALALTDAAIAAGVARFVQVSTSKVYGVNLTGRVTEGTPTRPSSHYAITHRAAEDYAARHPASVVLRLANAFGAPATPRMESWSVMVNEFCRQAVTSRQIVLRSDGLAWRSFIPLGDVVAAMQGAIAHIPSGTYNVGASSAMTLRQMAERVATVCEATTGASVVVRAQCSVAGSPGDRLDYRSDQIRAAGVSLGNSVDEEIVRTLRAAASVAGAHHV